MGVGKIIEVVQSVERTLSIIELLSDHNEGLGITDISGGVELHKSTVHRLLATLIYKGYVMQDPQTNKYRLTLKTYEIGCKRVENTGILEASKPYTKALMQSVNEVVHLVIRDGIDIVYIDKVEANNTIRMASRIGKRSPMYCTSVGKAMLAHMDISEVEKIWQQSKIEKMTENTIVDFDKFIDVLSIIRQDGYAKDDEENELGVRCVGAPIFNIKGEIEGAISVSGPTIRVTKDKIEYLAKEVKKFAELISQELGYKKNNLLL